jgi:hypothetical protein
MSALGKILRVAVTLSATAALLSGGATAALVEIGDLVLRADGGFTPQKLPRRAFAPIHFRGHADLSTKSGAMPPALQQAVVDFDSDGRLNATGLPGCSPEQVANASPEVARQTCGGAIVGTGHIEAVVAIAGRPPETAESPLTLFNGPSQDAHATVVAHAQITDPVVRTFAILIPVERRSGRFRYRATLDVPPIVPADIGTGALTHVDVKAGRRYTFRGKRRSYVSARCSDNILETQGRFTFSDGTVVSGSVMKGCSVRR